MNAQARHLRQRLVNGEHTGLGILLKLMAGDPVRIRAESCYTMPWGGVTARYCHSY